jgi:hypothetical protein
MSKVFAQVAKIACLVVILIYSSLACVFVVANFIVNQDWLGAFVSVISIPAIIIGIHWLPAFVEASWWPKWLTQPLRIPFMR